MSKSMYWSSHDLLSRNAMFSFAIGGRGTGKTYDFKRTRIKHFIKTHKQFIYLRRYKSEFDDRTEFFKDVAWEFPDYEFKVEGMKGYIRKNKGEKNDLPWEICCFFITLSNAITKKSVPYPDVDYIGFDEFIIDKGHIHYLTNEVKAFQDFYNTVDRFQDRVKVLFMANSISIVNPYFLAYHIKPRKGGKFWASKDGFVCVEIINSEEFVKHVDKTRFGQFIKGTAYYDYAVSNTFADDTDTFIAKKSETAQFYFAIKFDNKIVGVWVDYNEGIYYVSSKYPKDAIVYALTKADMEPNILMIEKTSVLLKGVRKLYMIGSVYFDSIETREFFNNVFDYINLR